MSEPIEKILYTKKEAAAALSICLSTLDVLIANKQIAVRRIGNRVRVPRSELLRIARQDTPLAWPAKVNGKTTRRVVA